MLLIKCLYLMVCVGMKCLYLMVCVLVKKCLYLMVCVGDEVFVPDGVCW